MSWLAAIALPVALWALGRRVLGRRMEVPALLAGTLLFYLALALLGLAGIPWTRGSLVAALAVLALFAGVPRLAGLAGRSSDPPREEETPEPGWGDAIALALLLAFAILAVSLWVTTPDFVYHWGLKGERFALARAIDFRFLGRPWNGGPGIHPDYPNLLPSLYAAGAILGGRFDAQVSMLWSAIWLGAILAAARGALRAARVERWTRQAAIAAIAAVLVTVAVGNLLAGGADWMIAIALVAAVPVLCGLADPGSDQRADRAADLQIGLAAAFAAASKIEGVPLAAFLVAAHLGMRGRRVLAERRAGTRTAGDLRRDLGSALAASALPPAAAIVPWAVEAARHGLFQTSNSGPFDWSRRHEIWRGWMDVAGSAPLHGLLWVFALLPLLWLPRRTRALAAVLSAQALFDAWAYFASSIDPWLYVLSNGSRLAFQLLPALLVGIILATEPRRPPAIAAR